MPNFNSINDYILYDIYNSEQVQYLGNCTTGNCTDEPLKQLIYFLERALLTINIKGTEFDSETKTKLNNLYSSNIYELKGLLKTFKSQVDDTTIKGIKDYIEKNIKNPDNGANNESIRVKALDIIANPNTSSILYYVDTDEEIKSVYGEEYGVTNMDILLKKLIIQSLEKLEEETTISPNLIRKMKTLEPINLQSSDYSLFPEEEKNVNLIREWNDQVNNLKDVLDQYSDKKIDIQEDLQKEKANKRAKDKTQESLYKVFQKIGKENTKKKSNSARK